VCSVDGGEGSRFEQELIDTDQTTNVSGWDILNRLDETTHHENGTLDSLDEQVVLLSWGVVRALDANLETRPNGTSKDTSEGVETTLIRGGYHLGDVQHEGTLGIAVTDGNGSLIIVGTLVQGLHSVALGNLGGRKMENHHFQEGISGGQELSHDNLEELLALEVLLVAGKLDLELFKNLWKLVLLEVHDDMEDLEDRLENEVVEGALNTVRGGCSPFLGLWVKPVVSLIGC
jgi:hypothetical protein